MFCPNCGQRQTSNDARFCAACGFPLNVVGELLANRGQLPWRPPAQVSLQPTPRTRGIRQGAFLMLSTLVVVPVVIFLGVALIGLPGELIPLTAVICVMGGLMRMLYALFFESNLPADAPPAQTYVPPAYAPNYFGGQQAPSALPPQQSAHAPAAYQRPPQRYNTGELAEPPRASVTDHTTRLLDKQPEEPTRLLDKQPDEPPRQ
ncbi:MAG TPA: zinc ribbon domain-containing protein [Pyrinomonadaceae bacterium]|nr:zinc ribbon domain-containing protein [Pyrinomonadaceae bacterium]